MQIRSISQSMPFPSIFRISCETWQRWQTSRAILYGKAPGVSPFSESKEGCFKEKTFLVLCFLLCIRARLQSCHNLSKMIRALAPAIAKPAQRQDWSNLPGGAPAGIRIWPEKAQGLKPNSVWAFYGTTKVVPWSFYIFSSRSRLNQLGRAEFEGKGIEQLGLLGHFFAQ